MIQQAGILAPSRFEIVNDCAYRTDLAMRKEVKFSLPGADLGKLRRLLDGNCQRIVHHNPVSLVRSVYFDTHKLAACYANVDGLGQRNKVRLRWYDQICPSHNFCFEVKWRKNRITGKHRLEMKSEKPLGEMSYAGIREELATSLPSVYQPFFLRFPEPVVLVEYKREHFVSREGEIRLTLDYDLVFYDQGGKSCISTRFAQPLRDLVVLEAKVPPGGEEAIRRILYPCPLRATRSSKYVHGCCMLGLIRSLH